MKTELWNKGYKSFHLRFIKLPDIEWPYTSACLFVFYQTGLYPVEILLEIKKTTTTTQNKCVCVCALFSYMYLIFLSIDNEFSNRALPLEFNKTIKKNISLSILSMNRTILFYYYIFKSNFLIKLFLILLISARSNGQSFLYIYCVSNFIIFGLARSPFNFCLQFFFFWIMNYHDIQDQINVAFECIYGR